MARLDKIKQALKYNIGAEDKIGFHNELSMERNNGEDNIYSNDEDFFETYFSNDPFNAVQRAVYGEYNPMHDFVMFNGYGNLKSMDEYELEKNLYSDNELAEFLDEHPDLIEAYGLELEDEEPNEVSEEQYYDALEVLPPFYFDTLNGKKVNGGFAVGEASAHRQTPDGFKATYSGYYKSGDKYFGIGEVYFLKTDGMGEPTGYSDDDRDAKTLDPDAFAKGGGVRRPLFSNREYSYGRNWTNDHRHENKSEDYEVPTGERKRKYAKGGITEHGLEIGDLICAYRLGNSKIITVKNENKYFEVNLDLGTRTRNKNSHKFATGGGTRTHNGREYSFGRAWTNDHRHENRREDWEVPQADRVRKFATGGGIELTDKQKKIDMNQNGRIDAEDFAILRKSMNGAWRNEHKHVNHSEKHETRYAKKTGSNRTGYKGRKDYAGGSSTKQEPYSKSSFSKSDWEKITALLSQDYSQSETNQILNSRLMRMTGGDNYRSFVKFYNENKKEFDKVSKEKFSGGGSTDKPKEPIAFQTSNLYFNGKGKDINGNSVVRVSFPNSRAFSIQTNGTLPKTHSGNYDEMEINSYVQKYGSPAQKKKLKIYK